MELRNKERRYKSRHCMLRMHVCYHESRLGEGQGAAQMCIRDSHVVVVKIHVNRGLSGSECFYQRLRYRSSKPTSDVKL